MKLCVDLGATNVKSGLVEENTIISSVLTPTDTNNGLVGVIGSLKKSIDKLINEGVTAICISSAGKIDSQTCRVIYATDNLPGYTGFDLRAWVSETYNLPCVAINDGLAALLGELALDEAYRSMRVAMLTLGSGVGGAYAVNGEIKADESNDFALFGHISIVQDGLPCNCGKRGCAEQYLSGRAINRFAAEQGIAKDMIFKEFAEGALRARAVVGVLREYLRDTLIKVSETSPFDVCILGGGAVDGMGDSFADIVGNLGFDIRRAKAGNAAGMLGAYYLGRELP